MEIAVCGEKEGDVKELDRENPIPNPSPYKGKGVCY